MHNSASTDTYIILLSPIPAHPSSPLSTHIPIYNPHSLYVYLTHSHSLIFVRYYSKVDSLNDSKQGYTGPAPYGGNRMNSSSDSKHSGAPTRNVPGAKGSGPPGYSGSFGSPKALPQVAALRRFEPPVIAQDYAGGLMVSKRSAGGQILGSSQKRFVQEQHVPQWDDNQRYDQAAAMNQSTGDISAECVVGPENPVVPYNANVSQCWDDEAGAVYYYNHSSGEASWLPPEA